jgi:hypothetical protein
VVRILEQLELRIARQQVSQPVLQPPPVRVPAAHVVVTRVIARDGHVLGKVADDVTVGMASERSKAGDELQQDVAAHVFCVLTLVLVEPQFAADDARDDRFGAAIDEGVKPGRPIRPRLSPGETGAAADRSNRTQGEVSRKRTTLPREIYGFQTPVTVTFKTPFPTYVARRL